MAGSRKDAQKDFTAFDADASGTLDFKEFCALVRAREPGAHPDDELRSRFTELDKDGSGTIDATEYICVSLLESLVHARMRMVDLLDRIDSDRNRKISPREFRSTLRELGFDAAREHVDMLFEMLDEDGSGEVDYKELVTALRPSTIARNKHALRRVCRAKGSKLGSLVKLSATSTKTVQEQLRAVLDKNRVRVIDLFHEWDVDESGTVSASEFREAVRSLGYDVPRADVDELFSFFDSDGGGQVEYKELHAALRKGARQMHRRGGEGGDAPRDAPSERATPPHQGRAMQQDTSRRMGADGGRSDSSGMHEPSPAGEWTMRSEAESERSLEHLRSKREALKHQRRTLRDSPSLAGDVAPTPTAEGRRRGGTAAQAEGHDLNAWATMIESQSSVGELEERLRTKEAEADALAAENDRLSTRYAELEARMAAVLSERHAGIKQVASFARAVAKAERMLAERDAEVEQLRAQLGEAAMEDLATLREEKALLEAEVELLSERVYGLHGSSVGSRRESHGHAREDGRDGRGGSDAERNEPGGSAPLPGARRVSEARTPVAKAHLRPSSARSPPRSSPGPWPPYVQPKAGFGRTNPH